MTKKTFAQTFFETVTRFFATAQPSAPATLQAMSGSSPSRFPKRSPVPKSLASSAKRARPQLPPPPTLKMKNLRAGRAYIRIMHALGHAEWVEIGRDEPKTPVQTQDFANK